jgi:DNA-binding GntR family transcriptional regulator
MGSSYVVEATGDLVEWGVIKTYNGTGTMIQFEDERDQVFPQIYYRVRVAE